MSGVPALARLQEAFAGAVAGEGAGGEAFAAHLAGDPSLALRRVALYRRAIEANRRGALRSAYPVVSRLVGDGFFDEAARLFCSQSPPVEADLNRYGAGFPAFLAAYAPAAGLPWLGGVARLEWAWHESLMAGDAPAHDFQALARVPETGQRGLRFELHPSVRLVRSPWPVLAIWEANQPGRDDLKGALAIPGIIESHGHFQGIGQAKLGLELMPATSWHEIVAMVGEAAKKARPGEWIVGRG